MTDEQWQTAWALFESARELPKEQRSRFAALASDDPEVSRRLLELLEEASAPQVARSGTRIGRYLVGDQIGRGGMGEVFAAVDAELGRRVALKFLSSDLLVRPSLIERFNREAKAASALNHPNIVTVYEIVQSESDLAIAMELVEGDPLRDYCGAPIPAARLVDWGRQIAQALAVAHARGLVHRDIKPENVVARPDGYVKILDFGLAQWDMPQTGSLSYFGLSGTLSYMSPEQTRGERATAASDVFSLGAVLYELAAGVHPFLANSPIDTAYAIAHAEPKPISAADAGVSEKLAALIAKMLAKDPRERPSAAEVERVLESLFRADPTPPLARATPEPAVARLLESPPDKSSRRRGTPELAAVAGTPVPARAKPKGLSILTWVAAAAAAVGLGVQGIQYFRSAWATPEVRVDIVAPPTDDRSSFALSPDGRRIAFAGSGDGGPTRLWVRELDSTSAHPLPGTEGASSPFWSPDSQNLGFFADFKLKRAGLGGARPQILAAVPSVEAQGTWGREGVILFAWGITPVHRVPDTGGQATVAAPVTNGQDNQFSPRFLPDGRKFLYLVNGVDPSIWMGSLDDAAPKRITSVTIGSDSAPEYLAPGWLVRISQGVLIAQPFDVKLGQLSGKPEPLDRSVSVDGNNLSRSFSVAASGAIAWRSVGVGRRQLLWFNRSGQNIGTHGGVGDANFFSPELSPDGKRVVTMRGPVGSADIWVEESIRSIRLTVDPADDRYPIWSPDGTRIVFASNRRGSYDLYRKEADGSGDEEILVQSTELKRPHSWSPDGRFIMFSAGYNSGDLMVLPLAGDRTPFSFLSTRFNEQQGTFSPDGKWVAYQSDESGEFEIYVRPFPGPGAATQASLGGGHSPRWRADGKELFYVSPDLKMMAAKVVMQESKVAVARPETLFQTHINTATNRQQYDVARDGRFLILTDLPEMSREPIHLLLNWRASSR